MSEPDKLKPYVTLKNWYYVKGVLVNEIGYLIGDAYGHPKHEDGEAIRTGLLIHFDPNKKFAETLTMKYKLENEKEEINI